MSVARLFFACFAWAFLLSSAAAESVPRIAIIIDDLGYQYADGLRAINLPGPVGYAVLPATPSGRALAHTAHEHGKEVLLHLPFEAVDRENSDEPGAITLDMNHDAFRRAFASALESVPHAVGVSNHRGSLLTRHPGHMSWLMEEIAAHEGMFFVDSYTTHHSVALQMAGENGVAATRRHVFLDNDRSAVAIQREFARLTRLAQRDGLAIAIGHPYPETLDFLEAALARLDASEIELIPVSQAVNFVEPDRSDEL